MYQNGEVNYLVATDAIGMGLNLDVQHVAFSATMKFDGQRMRPLMPNEMAQIAGRAGRYMTDGTFGVTGEAGALDAEMIEAIEEHRFAPLKKLNWRNSKLEFGTADALIRSLEQAPDDPCLVKARQADDLGALKTLAGLQTVRPRLRGGKDVRLLWDVCRVPDFRSISHGEHTNLLEQIFAYLHEVGRIPDDWLAGHMKRIDRIEGNIDTLSKRLAYVRTWTYVAQRKGWVDDAQHWQATTRAVEDRLSDALHNALTQRFVDRRTSVLLRRLKQKEGLVADVNDKGEVTVEGELIGRLEGFRFSQDQASSPDEAKTLGQAANAVLAPEFHLRADRFYNAPDTEMDFTEQGGLMWGEYAVGKLVAGDDALKPRVVAFVDDVAGPEVAEKVTRRLQHFIDRKVSTLFEPLLALSGDETLTGLARGFAFRLTESLGIVERGAVATEVKELDQEARGALRKHGIRFGQFTVFMPAILKPAPTRLRLLLWSLSAKHDIAPDSPPPGLVTIPALAGAPDGYYAMSGYRLAGTRAIRIDMLERLADLLRTQDSRNGFEANPDMLSITGMTLEQFSDLMGGLGYAAVKGERAKVKAPKADAPAADTPATEEAAPVEVVAEAETPAVAEEAPAEIAEAPAADAAPVEQEVFYTFKWGGNRGGNRNAGRGRSEGSEDGAEGGRPRGRKPQGKGKPQGKRREGGRDGAKGGNKAQSFSARPPRKEKAIDPDNPFAAALMALKDGK
jgi:ATP-dependent RNA helicase SUPV3L1/SUV3